MSLGEYTNYQYLKKLMLVYFYVNLYIYLFDLTILHNDWTDLQKDSAFS